MGGFDLIQSGRLMSTTSVVDPLIRAGIKGRGAFSRRGIPHWVPSPVINNPTGGGGGGRDGGRARAAAVQTTPCHQRFFFLGVGRGRGSRVG